MTSPKYTSKEVIEKYNLPVKKEESIFMKKEEILNSAPKYSREEIIAKYNLPVTKETPLLQKEEGISEDVKDVMVENISEPAIVNSKEILVKEKVSEKTIPKKPKEIPKQNLSYKNYAQVFRSINQTIQEDKKTPSSSSSDSEILSPKKEVLESEKVSDK
jgi:hypothetical protein